MSTNLLLAYCRCYDAAASTRIASNRATYARKCVAVRRLIRRNIARY
jgi:hypothetical protein